MDIKYIQGIAGIEEAGPVAVYFHKSPDQAAQDFEKTFGVAPSIVFVTADSVLPPIIYIPFSGIETSGKTPDLVEETQQNLEDQPADWFANKIQPYEQYC